MDTLYPNLYDRFKTEGLCPICFMEMELTPRYSCINGHNVCHRCKPYYYSCLTCSAPLDVEILPPQMSTPQPVHLMPHPMPPRSYDDHSPSAPPINDFLSHERRRPWQLPVPSENQQLEPCSYSYLGCWIKIPEHLRVLHESRCQFRPHSEEEHVPTDFHHDNLIECSFSAAGCKVRTVPWRRSIHEEHCIYKDKFQGVNDISDGLASATITDYGGDPNELVQCKFRRYGCMVNIPRRRKYIHEQKCNYRNHQGDVENEFIPQVYPSEPELDPDEQVECRWFEYGCRVRPKRCRKEIHEVKCNYRMEECMWKYHGCSAIFKPSLRYSHESNCDFAH